MGLYIYTLMGLETNQMRFVSRPIEVYIPIYLNRTRFYSLIFAFLLILFLISLLDISHDVIIG